MGLKASLIYALRVLILKVIIRPIDLFLDIIQWYFSSKTPNRYLNDNYAPIHEEHTSHNLPISRGSLPSELAGEFVRNGPNPKVLPKGGYHWFDGDGMLHGVRITKDGQANYFNRQTKTWKLDNELSIGMPLKTRIGEMTGKIGLIKILFSLAKKALGIIEEDGGTANTALVFHNKKLQALVEADVPYEIKMMWDGQLETAARLDYGGKIIAMTAHPKVDPVTNELFFFSYNVFAQPYLTYGYIDPSGNLKSKMDISIPAPVMMHDFAITEHFALFLDLSLVFDKKAIVTEGHAFVFDTKHNARVGIMDRYAKNPDGITWFSVPPAIVFHTANAWEEGDEVVLCTCKVTSNYNMSDPVVSSFGLVEWRFNMKTKESKKQDIVAEFFTEFPQINSNYLGRKNTYVYTVTSTSPELEGLFNGLLKINIQTKQILKAFLYGKNKYGGEAVFVPRQNAQSEDDGYLLTFVYDATTNLSSFWVIDAKSMEDIIAIVDLPQRVPYGFHGIYVSEKDIKSQLGY